VQGGRRNVCKILVGNPAEKKQSGVDVRTVLKWITEKYGVGVWIGLKWL
jgi:hypothetical protein